MRSTNASCPIPSLCALPSRSRALLATLRSKFQRSPSSSRQFGVPILCDAEDGALNLTVGLKFLGMSIELRAHQCSKYRSMYPPERRAGGYADSLSGRSGAFLFSQRCQGVFDIWSPER